MRIKDATVRLWDLHPGMVLALMVAQRVYTVHGQPEMVVTSAKDGRHSKNSLHYAGCAVDLRIWNLVDWSVPEFEESARRRAVPVVAEIQAALGPDYDVVLEKDHIHIELQPRGTH